MQKDENGNGWLAGLLRLISEKCQGTISVKRQDRCLNHNLVQGLIHPFDLISDTETNVTLIVRRELRIENAPQQICSLSSTATILLFVRRHMAGASGVSSWLINRVDKSNRQSGV